MPVEQAVVYWYLLGPLKHHPRNLIKITTKSVVDQITYLLAVGIFLGLISQLLKAENHSSIGTPA